MSEGTSQVGMDSLPLFEAPEAPRPFPPPMAHLPPPPLQNLEGCMMMTASMRWISNVKGEPRQDGRGTTTATMMMGGGAGVAEVTGRMPLTQPD